MLLVKKQMSEKLSELADQDFAAPGENDQLDFIETEGLKKSIHNLGTILTTNAALETVATGEGCGRPSMGSPCLLP